MTNPPADLPGQPHAPRFAFYSHDTMGLGHIRRNMLLTQAVFQARPDAEVLLISGVREAGTFALPRGADSVTLPTYFKTSDGRYVPRSLGQDVQRLVNVRSRIIHASLDAFEPDVVVIDNVPRGAMNELDSILPVLAKKGIRIVLGLRDIIDEPEVVQRQWEKLRNFEVIRDYFTTIWVYGDPHLYDLTEEYGFDAATRAKTFFMGYLDQTQRLRHKGLDTLPDVNRPYALCVVGGGQDGFRLAQAFVHARLPEGHSGVLVTGAMMPLAERERLRQWVAQRGDMVVVDFVAEPLELMQGASCIVSMGGYNTTTEILSFHKRALIVPRVKPRLEQWIRASRLDQLGLVRCLHPDALTPLALADWMAESHEPPDPRQRLRFDGLDRVAERIRTVLSLNRQIQPVASAPPYP